MRGRNPGSDEKEFQGTGKKSNVEENQPGKAYKAAEEDGTESAPGIQVHRLLKRRGDIDRDSPIPAGKKSKTNEDRLSKKTCLTGEDNTEPISQLQNRLPL
jgi:hypothetical protein